MALEDIATDDELDDVIADLEALADEHGRTNVMYAVHALAFGDTDWSRADSEGHALVTEGKRAVVEMRREETETETEAER